MEILLNQVGEHEVVSSGISGCVEVEWKVKAESANASNQSRNVSLSGHGRVDVDMRLGFSKLNGRRRAAGAEESGVVPKSKPKT